jgi:hypothetical protein
MAFKLLRQVQIIGYHVTTFIVIYNSRQIKTIKCQSELNHLHLMSTRMLAQYKSKQISNNLSHRSSKIRNYHQDHQQLLIMSNYQH